MRNYQLNDVDPEDIEDILRKIEGSFHIKFDDNEFIHITTFGELCDNISNKIELGNSDDCTTQQAFYKLRNSILLTLKLDSNNITPNTFFTDLLPRQSRLEMAIEIEKHLGLKISILRPPYFVTGLLVIIMLASFVELFFNWHIGIWGIVFSIGGLWLSNKFGKELDLKTVGQVAEKIARENYVKSRRNPESFNKKEIEKELIELFSIELCIDKTTLTQDSKFVR